MLNEGSAFLEGWFPYAFCGPRDVVSGISPSVSVRIGIG